jgi:radical S-adenosyl methionine domain-containing protein 2
VKTIERVRSVNPEILIKVNTVVNKFNFKENLTEIVERINPDKWKVLKVLPIVSDDLDVSEEQFQSFVNIHQRLGSVLSAENNQDMTESYLMVDPLGRFFQNQSNSRVGSPYCYSMPILQIGAEAAFCQINFDVEKFLSRYSKFPMGVAA